MDELDDHHAEIRSDEKIAVDQSLKRSIAAAIAAEPGFETSGVRISVSAGYVVLEGYVAEPDQIAKVVEIARSLSGSDRVKCFLFCWS